MVKTVGYGGSLESRRVVWFVAVVPSGPTETKSDHFIQKETRPANQRHSGCSIVYAAPGLAAPAQDPPRATIIFG